MDTEAKIKRKIERILAEVEDDSSEKDELLKGIETIISFVQESYKLTQSEVENLRSMFVEAVGELKNTTNENISVVKARLISYCEDEMSKMMKSHKEKLC